MNDIRTIMSQPDDIDLMLAEAFASPGPIKARTAMDTMFDTFRATLDRHPYALRLEAAHGIQPAAAKSWWARVPVWASIGAALACAVVVWMVASNMPPKRQMPTTNAVTPVAPIIVPPLTTNDTLNVLPDTTSVATCATPVSTNAVEAVCTANVGRIVGIIQTTDGKPVAGYYVVLFPVTAMYMGRIPQSVTPSDTNGMFTIAAVPTPCTYRYGISPSGDIRTAKPYVREHADETVRIQQGETVACIISVCPLPDVLLKVQDEQGTPLLSYMLYIKFRNGDANWPIVLSSDTWWRVSMMLHGMACENTAADTTMPISINVSTPGGACARTNIALRATDKDVYLTMQITPSADMNEGKELLASGWLKYVNGMPVRNGEVNGGCIGGGTVVADAVGRFEVYGTPPVGISTIMLNASCDDADLYTNVAVGTKDLVLRLPPSRYITGRVCIGTRATPATNFLVSIAGNDSGYGEGCNDKNGQFKRKVPQYDAADPCWVVKITCPPLAPVLVKVDEIPGTMVDLGDIVLTERAAELHGRVVARDAAPIFANVSMKLLDSPAGMAWVNESDTRTDDLQGVYDFSDLSTGRYCITAIAGAATTTTEAVIHRFGETVTVPDIVLDGE